LSANSVPRFTRQANISTALVNAANTNSDGTGNITTPTMYLLFTPDATNGSFLEFVRVMVTASTAATAGNATVIRLYLSSINSGATTSANTHLFNEVAIPVITADQTTTATNYVDVPIGFAIPAAMYVLASTHMIAATSTNNNVTAFGGDY
jgi:hypothetical protein